MTVGKSRLPASISLSRNHAANLSDTKSACEVLEGAVDKYLSLKAFSGGAGYRGTTVGFTSEQLGMTLYISEKSKKNGLSCQNDG